MHLCRERANPSQWDAVKGDLGCPVHTLSTISSVLHSRTSQLDYRRPSVTFNFVLSSLSLLYPNEWSRNCFLSVGLHGSIIINKLTTIMCKYIYFIGRLSPSVHKGMLEWEQVSQFHYNVILDLQGMTELDTWFSPPPPPMLSVPGCLYQVTQSFLQQSDSTVSSLPLNQFIGSFLFFIRRVIVLSAASRSLIVSYCLFLFISIRLDM